MRLQPSDRIPDKPKGTLKAFKSLQDFFDFFKDLPITSASIPQRSGTYSGVWDSIRRDAIEGNLRNATWFGNPLPNSVQDALDRERYMNMDEFNRIYRTNIQPRLQEILKKSAAELEMPALKYNDLGLGTFDFNKASTGLIALYKYYSFKKKELVDGSEVETFKDKDKYKYRLKSDGSPVALVPKIEFKSKEEKKKVELAYKEIYDGGNVFVVLKKHNLKISGSEAFSSTIKKSYLLKEKVPKPKNAVRVFIKIGANANISAEQYKWSGYAAIGVAELLSIMGYAVSIIAIYGNQTEINLGGASLEYGFRFWGINLKSFQDSLDKSSLLYICSDATFFRVKIFEDIIKQAEFYKDYVDTGLGSSAYIDTVQDMIYNEYGKRDKLFNMKGAIDKKSQFLYYIIGDVLSEADLNKKILDIGLDVVNQNKEAREKILGL